LQQVLDLQMSKGFLIDWKQFQKPFQNIQCRCAAQNHLWQYLRFFSLQSDI
jgi:hypothetical protein